MTLYVRASDIFLIVQRLQRNIRPKGLQPKLSSSGGPHRNHPNGTTDGIRYLCVPNLEVLKGALLGGCRRGFGQFTRRLNSRSNQLLS